MVILDMKKAGEKMEGRDKVVLMAQEITFAKALAGNDLRQRDRALRKLRKWLQNRAQPNQPSPFTRDDMMRIWKGLFFSMYMSDKPLIQEELAENISSLMHCFSKHSVALTFVEAFFLTMRADWALIDTFRINKFQMFVRRMLRQALILVANKKWTSAPQLAEVLWSSVLSAEGDKPPPLGLGMHLCEIFLEEVAKVSGSQGISQKGLSALLRVFARCLASKAGDARLRTTVSSEVFGHLIRQSDAGIEHQEKLQAWQQMGCPAIPLEQLQRVEQPDSDVEEGGEQENQEMEEEEEEKQERVLDPRAGQLDVELPQIPFDPIQVAALINKFIGEPGTNAKARRRLKHVAQKFEQLARGKYPLGFKVPVTQDDGATLQWQMEDEVEDAAEELQRFEQQLQEEEMEMGVASSNTARRLKQNQMTQPRAKRRNRRKKPAWRVTQVDEAVKSNGVSTSPGTQGQWEVSPIAEREPRSLQDHEPSSLQERFTDWDQPLQEGEYEYVVTPKKKTAKKQGKKRRSTSLEPEQEEVETGQQNGKSPEGPEPNEEEIMQTLRENVQAEVLRVLKVQGVKTAQTGGGSLAVASPSTPVSKKRALATEGLTTPVSSASRIAQLSSVSGSGKRVGFQLKRNMFQEVHEHAAQIRSSPGIPHDPKKRPVKGLLKPSTPCSSPLITKKRARVIL